MALNVTIGDQVPDYLKEGSADVLFGLQIAAKDKMLQIYNAAWGSNDAITGITAVKIGTNKREISRTSLATDLIVYDTDKYITDVAESYTADLDFCIYYIEFTNASTTFKTELFLVQNFDE